MFKDIYKRANDSIPTGTAYTRVMNRLEQPKPHREWGKSFARAAALAACLIFTFSVVSIYETRVKAPKDIVIGSSENEPEKMAESTPKAEPKPASTQKPVVAKAQVQNTAKPQISASPAGPEQVETETVGNEIKINDLSILAQDTAAAYAREVIGAVKVVEIGEYCEYLGKDIEVEAVLPERFVNATEQTAFLTVDEEDNYMNDEWCFLFADGEDFCEIVTTRKTEAVQKHLDNESYEKSIVGGKDAVVFAEDDFIRAYAVSDGIGYTVTTVGATEQDAEVLLESILK